MPLEEGLTERGWEIDVVACIGQRTIHLKGRRVPRVEEAVRCWSGGSPPPPPPLRPLALSAGYRSGGILVAVREKAISILMETTESALRYPSRENTTRNPPRDLFTMVTWPNVNWNLPGVALMVTIARLRKSSQTFL